MDIYIISPFINPHGNFLVYYVVTVLHFDGKSSPMIYHSLTEAVCMYVRSLGKPMLCWIDDMLGCTE